jgi:tRNA G46 methylase TrmB
VQAFEAALRLIRPGEIDKGVVLDSGCGTGDSTRALGERYPGHLVIGVDRSLHRLRKSGLQVFPGREGNVILVQAELASFWRLARSEGWLLLKHKLLYPNPCPKRSQWRSRWHAHPVFPSLMALGGQLEMCSNWDVYASEFASAASLVIGAAVKVESFLPESPRSPFERKYANSGHTLYRVQFAAGVAPEWTKAQALPA